MKKWSWILICLLAVSCTVTKRHYRKGFHVQWHHPLPERVGSGETHLHQDLGEQADQEVLDTLQEMALASPVAMPVEDPSFYAGPFLSPAQEDMNESVLPEAGTCSRQVMTEDLQLHRHAVIPVPPFSPLVEVPGKQEADHSLLFGILALCLFLFLFFPAVIFGIPAIESGKLACDHNRDQDTQVTQRARVGILLGRIALCLVFAVLVAAFIGLVIGFFAVYGSAEMAILALTLLCMGAFLVGILLALMTWVMVKYVF